MVEPIEQNAAQQERYRQDMDIPDKTHIFRPIRSVSPEQYLIAEAHRHRIFRALKHMRTISQLRDELGITDKKLRYHVELLERGGLIEAVNRKNAGMLYLYFQRTDRGKLLGAEMDL